MLSRPFFLRFHPPMVTSILSHSTLTAWHLLNSTMRYMTRNYSPFFDAFWHWRNYLEGSTHIVLVLSNHKNLEYFSTTKQLTCQQVHWSEYLSGFNYLIRYCAGCLGTKPDALTRREDVYPQGENVYALANPHNFHLMFKPGQLLRAIILDLASLLISIKHGLVTDPLVQAHMAQLWSTNAPVTLGDAWSLSQDGKFLLYKGAVYVPDHQDV